jgi:N-acyl-D-amino-acid deacylase
VSRSRTIAVSVRSLSVALLLGAAACGDGDPRWSTSDPGPYDLLVLDGQVLDGSGADAVSVDLGIRDGVIVAIADLSDQVATDTIDASGLHVTPGFVDTHSHAGPGLATEGLSHARPLLAQGLTTVFVNPDGGGPTDLAEQRERLLADGLGVNAAQLISHGSVRRAVLGMEDRAPTSDELDAMRALVRTGMREGAWGLSSGTFYSPGSYSDNEEIIELAKVAAEFGGAYTSHIRDESNYTIGVVAAVDEVIDVARQAGLPSVVTHIKALGPPVWGKSAEIVQHIEAARAEGLPVFADQYPYEASATGLSAALLPRWAQAGGSDSLRARLDDADIRARIRAEMVENLARRGGADRIQFRRYEADESLEGRLLSDIAAERGMDPIDYALELFRTGSPSIVSFNMSDEDVRTLMVQPWTMTSSDGDLVPWEEGVPHPRSYGAFSRKIRKYVVEDEVVDLPGAIHSMTGLPADVFNVPDRGRLEVGKAADIAVFDLARVNDPATFTDPHQLSEGMVHVLVNGVPAIRDGDFTGELPGVVLRRGSPIDRPVADG